MVQVKSLKKYNLNCYKRWYHSVSKGGSDGSSFSKSLARQLKIRKRDNMLNILTVEEMPSEQDIDKAEQLFFFTMEVGKSQLSNKSVENTKLCNLLISNLYHSLVVHDNFSKDGQLVKDSIAFVIDEYASKGMPKDNIEADNEYFLIVFKMVLTMACDERVISFCDELFS